MALSRYSRRALAALTAAGALAAPAVITPSAAQAAPQSSVGSIDHLGRPAPHVLNQLDAIAKTLNFPRKFGKRSPRL